MGKKGFYHKYIIKKADGSPISPMADYFVLRLDTDRAARIAAMAYAEAILSQNPRLAGDLADRIREHGGL